VEGVGDVGPVERKSGGREEKEGEQDVYDVRKKEKYQDP